MERCGLFLNFLGRLEEERDGPLQVNDGDGAELWLMMGEVNASRWTELNAGH